MTDRHYLKGLMLLFCSAATAVSANNTIPFSQAFRNLQLQLAKLDVPNLLNSHQRASVSESLFAQQIKSTKDQETFVQYYSDYARCKITMSCTPPVHNKTDTSANDVPKNVRDVGEDVSPEPLFEESLADDASDDIFAKEEEIKPEASGNFFHQLWGNKKLEASYLYHYFPFKPVGKSTAPIMNHFGIFDFASIANIGKHLQFYIDGYADYTTKKDILHGVFTAPENNAQSAKYLDARELYFKYSAKRFDILVGKAFIDNGLADPVTITNRYNTSNRLGFQNVIGMGTWQTRFDYFINNNNEVSFIVIPFENKISGLPDNSRWLGPLNIDIGQIVGASVAPTETPIEIEFPAINIVPSFTTQYRNADPKNWGYMFKYTATRRGYDYFFSVHYGPGLYSVIKFDPQHYQFVSSYPDAFNATSGITISSGNLNVFGELLYQYTLQGRDVNFIDELIGLKYTDTEFADKIGFKEITPIIEVSHETITRKQTKPLFFFSSEVLHVYTHDVMIGLLAQQTDKWGYIGGFDYDYQHDDYNYFAGINYKRSDALDFQALWTAYTGTQSNLLNPNEGLYGLYRNNDNVSFRVTYRF